MSQAKPARPDGLPFETVALVLQGGGALGAYQGGVVEGLAEAGIEVDWLAGVSIGGLNAALIAGNPPGERVSRLREFWETICQPALFQPTVAMAETAALWFGGPARMGLNAFQAWRALVEGQRGFFVPRPPGPWMAGDAETGTVGFYDTAPLKATLERVVDFERINAGRTRVTLGAVNLRSGNLELFDNTRGDWRGRLRAEHFMASGALPPGFPPVEIDGEFYWDGGLVSNTPLATVLSDDTRRDTLAFQVDLWSARGPLPGNVIDAQERQKDIQYSSRTRMITDLLAHEQRHRKLLRKVLEHVPPSAFERHPELAEAREAAVDRRFCVIHLIYQDKEWDGLSKDYEFGPLTMREHWASGLADIRRTLKRREWLTLPTKERPFVTHDVHRAE